MRIFSEIFQQYVARLIFFVLKITSNAFLEFLFYQFLSFDLSQFFFFHSFPPKHTRDT